MVYDAFMINFQLMLVIFVRLIGLFVTAPFFSGTAVPFRVTMGLGFFISLICLPVVAATNVTIPKDIVDYGWMLLVNFVIGAGIGFVIFIISTAFQTAAQIFSIPMGMGMNEVVDPLSQIQIPAVGNLLAIMLIFLLIRIDGHIYMIQLIVESFKRISTLNLQSLDLIMKGMSDGVMVMIDISLRISMPIIFISLLLDMAMGLISKVAPQLNVMVMGFNIKLLLGFFVLWLALPTIVELGATVVNGFLQSAYELIRHIGAVT